MSSPPSHPTGGAGRDDSDHLRDRVRSALARGERLRIVGSDSKAFFGRESEGTPLALDGHTGIVGYEPSELVVTARAGTPLAELEAVLAQHNQRLGFEPPHFGPAATLGGTIACGLSGPVRPYAGAARDFVLGTVCLTGKGEILRFGGQVMKNVAGYDVSRLMTGALGTLGVVLEISLRVLPLAERELTLVLELSEPEALDAMHRWEARPLPLSATCYDGQRLYVRLSGTERGVAAARQRIGGEERADGPAFWHRLREQQGGFFAGTGPLWRLSVPADAAPLPLAGTWLLEWGGAQRWLRSEAPPDTVRAAAAQAGGHASLFRGGDRTEEVFHPLPPALLAIHRRLKAAFDPQGLFNPGRLYRDL